jgi:AraC-like DNA-binding protein
VAQLHYGRIRQLGGLPHFVRSLAGEQGLNRVFRDQNLPVALLDTPDAAVPVRDILGLYHRAAQVTGIRRIGLDSSKGFDAAHHGLTGRYVMQAPDLLSALGRIRAVLPYYETGSSLLIEAEGDEMRFRCRSACEDVVGWRHKGDFSLRVIADVISGYLGDDWTPLRIETGCVRGGLPQDREDWLHAPVRCGQGGVAIVLDRDSATSGGRKRAKPSGPTVSLADLRRLGETLPRDLPHVVANIVARRLIDGATDLDGAAATLGVGPRTLQRRLRENGLSYHGLVTRCRMRRARDLLAEPDLTVGRVGRELGYASTPQFTRAFKAWFETTPHEFRQSKN